MTGSSVSSLLSHGPLGTMHQKDCHYLIVTFIFTYLNWISFVATYLDICFSFRLLMHKGQIDDAVQSSTMTYFNIEVNKVSNFRISLDSNVNSNMFLYADISLDSYSFACR